jgi:hypothetical protein
MHAVGRLCLGEKAKLSSALYLSLAIGTVAYAVYRAGDGLEAGSRWAWTIFPGISLFFGHLVCTPAMLDLRHLGTGGGVLLRLDQEARAWLRPVGLLVAL